MTWIALYLLVGYGAALVGAYIDPESETGQLMIVAMFWPVALGVLCLVLLSKPLSIPLNAIRRLGEARQTQRDEAKRALSDGEATINHWLKDTP